MVSIKFEIDNQTGDAMVLPQMLSNKFNLIEYSNPDYILIKNPRGLCWRIKKYNTAKIVDIVLGKKSIPELKREYEALKSKSKFNRKLRNMIYKLIKFLRKLHDKLES